LTAHSPATPVEAGEQVPHDGLAPEVRRAGASDVGLLTGLHEAAVAELAPQRGGRALLGLTGRGADVAGSFAVQVLDSSRAVFLGMSAAGVAVGYATCSFYDLDGGQRLGRLDELFVLAEARRLGVGRALAGAGFAWCQAQGCTGVDANALPGNRAAKSFFESAGLTARLLVMHRSFG
jgi:GNAT superfamily N-acetyltransferase